MCSSGLVRDHELRCDRSSLGQADSLETHAGCRTNEDRGIQRRAACLSRTCEATRKPSQRRPCRWIHFYRGEDGTPARSAQSCESCNSSYPEKSRPEKEKHSVVWLAWIQTRTCIQLIRTGCRGTDSAGNPP